MKKLTTIMICIGVLAIGVFAGAKYFEAHAGFNCQSNCHAKWSACRASCNRDFNCLNSCNSIHDACLGGCN